MRLCSAILLLLPVVSIAEPGPASSYLLQEPVTLMDLGLERMNREADIHGRQVESLIRSQTPDTDLEVFASSRYDDLDDRFLLTYILRQADDAQTYCSVIFDRYSDEEGFFAIVVGWFAKYRFVESLENPDALYAEIASRTEIRCRSTDIEGVFRPTTGDTLWTDAAGGEEG